MSIKTELLSLPWIEHIDLCKRSTAGIIIHLKEGWRFRVDDTEYQVASTWSEAQSIAGHVDKIYKVED